ncbi:putative ribonuclease H-like domain-containing protein [Tanacetum coccineum]|uniref:Ribonuclease H-like domain-containing protein n=1 Tax=Tanacetum coccineum TaxID=301880 RepID=A0ABQ5AV38_9ASTR
MSDSEDSTVTYTAVSSRTHTLFCPCHLLNYDTSLEEYPPSPNFIPDESTDVTVRDLRLLSLSPLSAEETELFETDESAATLPPHPAYHVTTRMSIRDDHHKPFGQITEVVAKTALIYTLLQPPSHFPNGPSTIDNRYPSSSTTITLDTITLPVKARTTYEFIRGDDAADLATTNGLIWLQQAVITGTNACTMLSYVQRIHTQVVVQQAVITELQAADHRRQSAITRDSLAVDSPRQAIVFTVSLFNMVEHPCPSPVVTDGPINGDSSEASNHEDASDTVCRPKQTTQDGSYYSNTSNQKLLARKSSCEKERQAKDFVSVEMLANPKEPYEKSIGTSSEHSVDPESEISSVPPEVYVSKPITTNEKGMSDPKSKEVEPSCVSHIKTPRQPIKDQATPKVNRKNWNAMMERELGEGYSFTKKKCFVCGSLSHLIKDCDYYEKKMAREAEFKKQRVFNTGNRVAKPVWTNANRVNHANQFVPKPVQLNAGRAKINSVRPNINTGRTNVNSVRPRVSTVSSNVNTVRSRQPVPTKTSNSFSPKRPQVNLFNQRRHFSKSHSSVRRPFAKITAQMSHSHAVKENWGSAVKTSAGYNWRNSKPHSNCDSGPTFFRTDHPLKNMVDRGIFDSGCSGHMTGNKDQLEDFEEFNGGSVTFGGSKGYISGKGKIRVGNLDFDSVSFVKELGHFNLFSISQICDKQHKVLFTETECLVVSSNFKMPDENQILLKVPRHHNMYSFDMKTPTPAKGFACLIAKATSDESKLWHKRLGHINFKNLNKLVKGNLVRGLPSKVFKNDHTCVACHRFSCISFLTSKDETSGILQNFIRQIENQLSHRVKIIRSDNGTEFKNRDMLEFCGNKGIKQEYSNARTPQQNGVAERMNRTLIEAARTMLADSLLPTTFWAEAVSTACYIFNRVRVTKPQNKTPYELLFGHKPIISYIRPFGCHVTILDTLSVLGKFDGKSDEGFLVGYSLNSKAYRVYNLVTKRVKVNLHVNFLKDKPNVKGVGYRWMFDIDYLTDSMNYIPVSLENQANQHACASEVTNSAGTSQTSCSNASEEKDEEVELIIVPSTVKNTEEKVKSRKSSTYSKKKEILTEPQQEKKASSTDTSEDNPKILAFRRELGEIALKHLGKISENTFTSTPSVNPGSESVNTGSFDPNDSPMPELEIFHKSETGIFDEASYDEEGVITDFNSLPTEIEVSPTPTLRIHNIHPKSQILGDPKELFYTKKISEALQDDSWVQAMQEELLQFKLQQVWVLVDLPHGMKVIDEEVYVSQPPGFVDPDHPKKVYKVVKALYGLHQAPRAWYATLSTFLEKHGYKRGTIDKTLFIKRDKKDIMLVQVYVDDIIFGSTKKSWCDEFEALMKSRFQMSSMGELTFFLGLQVKQNKAGIFISQDKYVAEILKKFDLVTPKTSHLSAVKRIFKYLKGKPNLGLWYPRESPFDLEAFSDSDYGGSNLDRKSTTGGCQFLGQRLISWQCKKQTIVATSTTEAEYVAAANCCGQVLWVQNQLLDYGFNFMNTKIHIDNESTICIVKNPVYHSKTKHIEIRHHFIRDCYEKKLISVEKIHTDLNVADLLTKPFDGPRFNYLVVVSLTKIWLK